VDKGDMCRQGRENDIETYMMVIVHAYHRDLINFGAAIICPL